MVKTMIAFGCGVGATLLYEKYNREIMMCFKKSNKKLNEVK